MAGEETLIHIVNHFPELAEALHKAIADAVKASALDLAATYSANAPRDTGFMAESAYTVTIDGSTYRGEGDVSEPVVEKVADDHEAYAAVAASYAPYPELGTVHQAAQPAFYPAGDKAEQTLADGLAKIVDVLQAFSVGE